jgi:hypothetical protein
MAKILLNMLFLKIILIVDFDEFYSCISFLASFRPSTKLPRHTCGPFASHQCAATHRLKIAAVYRMSPPVTATEQGTGSVDPSDVRRLFCCFKPYRPVVRLQVDACPSAPSRPRDNPHNFKMSIFCDVTPYSCAT